MTADRSQHLWVYSAQAQAGWFHLLATVSDETSDWRARNGKATTVCSPHPRWQFETSMEPPEYLEMCDKCALHDFEAWVVYRCFAADGEVLYVGVTNDLELRMRSHKHCKEYSYRWYPQVARIEADIYGNRYEAGAAERAAIQELKPTFNITTYRNRQAVA